MSEELNLRKRVETTRETKKKITRIAIDFMTHRIENDFISRIKEAKLEANFEYVPKILMSVSFDKNESERKSVANLIINLVMGHVISQKNLADCFKILLTGIYDLIIDVPHVVSHLEFFVNRFIDCKVLEFGDSSRFLEVLSVYSGSEPRITIKKIVKKVFENYFVSGQVEECCREMMEIEDEKAHPLIVKYCISLSFDKEGHERELVSQFLANVVSNAPNKIKRESLEEGITILLNCIENLYDDVPLVYQFLSFFVARAIHDEILAPAFLKKRSTLPGDSSIVLENAEALLKMENSSEELEQIWDCNVDDLLQIKLIVRKNVEAFFDVGGDADTFHRFMLKLGHPHFHYRVVYQLFSTLLDRKELFREKVADLIASLVDRGISTSEEIEKGYDKIERLLPELEIDNPGAGKIFNQLKKRVKQIGLY